MFFVFVVSCFFRALLLRGDSKGKRKASPAPAAAAPEAKRRKPTAAENHVKDGSDTVELSFT